MHLYISYRQLYKFSKILSHLYLRLPMQLQTSSGSGKMPSRLYPYMPIVHSGFLHGRIAVMLDPVTLFMTFNARIFWVGLLAIESYSMAADE